MHMFIASAEENFLIPFVSADHGPRPGECSTCKFTGQFVRQHGNGLARATFNGVTTNVLLPCRLTERYRNVGTQRSIPKAIGSTLRDEAPSTVDAGVRDCCCAAGRLRNRAGHLSLLWIGTNSNFYRCHVPPAATPPCLMTRETFVYGSVLFQFINSRTPTNGRFRINERKSESTEMFPVRRSDCQRSGLANRTPTEPEFGRTSPE